MLAAMVLGVLASAAPVQEPTAPRVLGEWRIGIWMEIRSDPDTSIQRRWADSVVTDFSHRLSPLASAKLVRFTRVAPGGLPLSGGDPRHHPELRATDLDAAWGVLATDSLTASTARRAQRAWLSARGCPDERNFGVGWDLYLLANDTSNHLGSIYSHLDARNNVYSPRWSMLPDTGLDPACGRILQIRREGGLELFSATKLQRALRDALPRHLAVGVLDDGNRPAIGATLEIWRGVPDPRRPFANRLEGRPEMYLADSSGRFPIRTGLDWLSKDSLVFGPLGGNAVSYWRLRSGKRSLEGWMDAVQLVNLPRREGWSEQYWRLPSGSSDAWKQASGRWPQPWVAAQADSTGLLTLGLSVPNETDFVLRILDSRGKEKLRTAVLHFAPGVHERSLKVPIAPGWWDVRLDNPVDRFQLRVNFPAPWAVPAPLSGTGVGSP